MPRYTLHIDREARDDRAVLALRDLLARTLRRRVWVTDADNWAETVTATCVLANLEGPVVLAGEHVPACAGTLVSRGVGRRVCEAHATITDAQIQDGLRRVEELTAPGLVVSVR